MRTFHQKHVETVITFGLFLILGLVPSALHAADTAKKSAASKTVTATVTKPANKNANQNKMTVHVRVTPPGKYWLGIVCAPIDDELLEKQLGIRGGLVVRHVVPDSPAAKAGLQQYDIIVKVGNNALPDLETLVATVDHYANKPLPLTVYRKAQRKVIKVTPTKRPGKVELPASATEAASEWKALAETLRKYGLNPEETGRALDSLTPKRFFFVMPGLVVPEGLEPVPDDLEVTITKKGDQPAQIIVKHDGKTWKVDADSLDKLPPKIRPHVRRMLGQSSGDFFGEYFPFQRRALEELEKLTPDMFRPSDSSSHKSHQSAAALEQARKQIEQSLNAMQQKLDTMESETMVDTLKNIRHELQQMRRQLEQLRKQQKQQAPASKEKSSN